MFYGDWLGMGESTTENPVKDTGSSGSSWQGPELDFIINIVPIPYGEENQHKIIILFIIG